ncbi:unnamed protein product [Durusdinium trenchii]|uniref:C3H1-type domain-containing protein n=1 Tax=Durusdinium trenchii TaxID=1381693 RepID=A0ABP0JAN3_9DINO
MRGLSAGISWKGGAPMLTLAASATKRLKALDQLRMRTTGQSAGISWKGNALTLKLAALAMMPQDSNHQAVIWGTSRWTAKGRLRRPVCRHFLEGKCTFGDLCRFSHDAPRGPIFNSQGAEKTAVADDRPVCRHFLEGKCTFGDLCRFSHDAPRGPIFNSQGAEKTAVADDRSVCRHFLEGKCTFGDACRFSHALPGAHSSWGFPVDERPVCRHFLEGKCTYGHDCRFSHDAMAGRQEPWRAQPAPMKPLPLPFRLGSGLDGITIGLQLWASKDFPKGAAFSAIDSGKEETVRLERPEPGVSGTQGLWETVDNAGDRGGYRRQSQHCNWTVFLQDEDLSEDLILLGDAQNIAARSGPHFVGAGELGDWKNGVEFPQEEGSVVFCGCPSSQKNSWNLGLGAALGWYSSGMA